MRRTDWRSRWAARASIYPPRGSAARVADLLFAAFAPTAIEVNGARLALAPGLTRYHSPAPPAVSGIDLRATSGADSATLLGVDLRAADGAAPEAGKANRSPIRWCWIYSPAPPICAPGRSQRTGASSPATLAGNPSRSALMSTRSRSARIRMGTWDHGASLCPPQTRAAATASPSTRRPKPPRPP